MALRVAVGAFFSLVVAMGIGRFAFTPQVPLMINQHQLNLTSAAVVAALNYLGYLFGAFDAMRAQRHIEWRLHSGVWGAVIVTLLSAWADNSWQHGILRFIAGCTSGWAMVLVTSWSNEKLLHCGRPGLSAAVFAGPGVGIFISGMLSVLLHMLHASAAVAWGCYGLLALILVALIARYLPRHGQFQRPETRAEVLRLTPHLKRLVVAYTLAGFGYILPATFLSQMASARFPDKVFAQFVWPIFGAAAVIGVGIGILTRRCLSTQRRLALTLWVQAIGVFAAGLLPGMAGLIIGAALVGGGFLSVVQLVMQYARELAPRHARYLAGFLTTGYAIGQLSGPILSALSTLLMHRLEPALYVAGLGMSAAGWLVWRRDK